MAKGIKHCEGNLIDFPILHTATLKSNILTYYIEHTNTQSHKHTQYDFCKNKDMEGG